MELEFQSHPFRYLRQILCRNLRQEAVMETIVPDSFPDVERVLLSTGVPLVRSRECRTGTAAVSGGVRVTVMYASAEHADAPQSLELYLPFSVKCEQNDLNENTAVQADVTITSIDTRMINSRKLIVRVNLNCCMMAYAPEEVSVSAYEAPSENVQVKRSEYVLTIPVETSECSFPVHDRIPLPKTAPYGGCVYAFTPQWTLTEQRITGNKAVFKGQLSLKLLYKTADGALRCHECTLPFSQFCTLQELYDEEEMQVSLLLGNCEWEICSGDDGDELSLSVEFTAQCTVYGKLSIRIIEDAYCLSGVLEPQWEQIEIFSRLDSRDLQKNARETWSGDAECVEFCHSWLGEITTTQCDGVTNCSIPVVSRVLFRDKGGILHGETCEMSIEQSIPASEEATPQISAKLLNCGGTPIAGGVELYAEAALEINTYLAGKYDTVCGGNWEVQEGDETEIPVIIRRVGEGDSLWDIAKAHRTTVTKLCAVNHLEDEKISENKMIIIPV